MNNENNFMSPDELAAYLNVHRNRINYWVNEGMIPFIKIGNHIFFDCDKVASWLQKNSYDPVNKKQIKFLF